MRRARVEHEVDARLRDLRREPLHQLDRLEAQGGDDRQRATRVCDLARAHGLEMPLFEHIHRRLPVAQAIASLMEMPTGRDVPRWSRAR